jgi:DNA-binding CsgD family transcriptional regulator
MSLRESHHEDLRPLLRLLSDLAISPAPLFVKRRLLMNGHAKIIQADSWISGIITRESDACCLDFMTLLHGGFDHKRLSKLLFAIEHPETLRVFTDPLRHIRLEPSLLTVKVNHCESWPEFQSCEPAQSLRECDFGDAVVSMRPIDDEKIGIKIFIRGHEESPFNEREVQLTHDLMTEAPWMHNIDFSNEVGIKLCKLTPRRRDVFNLLIQGRNRKDMAEILGISAHTLNGYVKDIFRHFAVHSQSELIARFRSREDDSDTPGCEIATK